MCSAKPYQEDCVTRATRTLVFADVVESVRLFEQDEDGTAARWFALVAHVESGILRACGGRLVKSLGDGLLIEFPHVPAAVSAVFAIQHACHRGNVGHPAGSHILLRIGIEVGEVLVVQHDVFGHGVNLAERLSTLAGPGETVVSAHVREQLTPALDADVEDLGECFLKHVQNPVRAYRVGPPGPRPVIEPSAAQGDMRPTVAVVPFSTPDPAPEHRLLGEVLAEEVIRELSRSPDLNVISRLSTAPFRERGVVLAEISAHLSADYVLSGSYVVDGGQVELRAELAEAKSGRIVWTRCARDGVAGVVWGEQELIAHIVADVRAAVSARELQRAQAQARPTLKNYTLLMAAVALMHRLSLRDFEEAHHLLQTLIDRARREALPQAWLAKWYVLRVQQGWSPDPKQDALRALQCTRQALDADPRCSLALAIDGLVYTNLLKRLDVAQERYTLAIETNPNDSLAWLLKGTMHAFMGDGRQAVESTQRALLLSPLDPHRYYYDALAGTACLAAGQYERALRLAHRSLRENRTHTSTLRVAAIAAWRLGFHDEARSTVQKLLKLEPTLTIGGYLERTPAAPFSTGKDWSDALHQAGVPN